MSDILVEVNHLKKHFQMSGTFLGRLLGGGRSVVKAVDDVSLQIKRGEVFGLVGESGCGKTTLGRAILRLTEPSEGSVTYDGQDITHIPEGRLRPLRRQMQIIFQDPHSALNPAMTVGRAIGDPLEIHGLAENEEMARERVLGVMREVGLEPAESLYDRYPRDLSGGQKQRVVIARAIILRPSFVVADEAVAMLDMSVRAKILELLMELKEKYGLTYLFITHDLATAKFLCHRIAIMYLGKVVEMGEAQDIYTDPWHPYTRALLRAIPVPDPTRRGVKDVPKGEVPDAVSVPNGCRFHPRCPMAFEACGWEPRDMLEFLESQALNLEVAEAVESLDSMSVSGNRLRIPLKDRDAMKLEGSIRSLLKRNSPLSSGVERVEIIGDHLSISFRSIPDLLDLEIKGRLISCHLYDPRFRRTLSTSAGEGKPSKELDGAAGAAE